MSRHNTDHYHTPNPADGSEAASKDAGASVVYVRPKDVHLTLADLTEAESLVLWAIRTWVRGFMRDIPVAKSIVNGLRRAHAEKIFMELDGLMSLFGRNARRRLDVRCPACGSLSPDEYGFLLLIGAAQAGLKDLVQAVAREGLEPPAPSYGALQADRLAANLRAGGIELPVRTPKVAKNSSTHAMAPLPGNRTVH